MSSCNGTACCWKWNFNHTKCLVNGVRLMGFGANSRVRKPYIVILNSPPVWVVRHCLLIWCFSGHGPSIKMPSDEWS